MKSRFFPCWLSSIKSEAFLAVGVKLKTLSVHYYAGKWEIEVKLVEDDCSTD
jgi:hypothetical protein